MTNNYLTKFDTLDQYEFFLKTPDYKGVNTSYITELDQVKYVKSEVDEKWAEIYNKPFTLTIDDIPGDDNNAWNMTFEGSGKMKYKINDGEWIDGGGTSTTNTGYNVPHVHKGDSIQFIFDISDSYYYMGVVQFNSLGMYAEPDGYDRITVDMGIKFTISGNLLSLHQGDEYNKLLGPTKYIENQGDLGFYTTIIEHIRGGITDASGLWLPVLNLSPHCFSKMFWECQNLVKGPNIYAKSLPHQALYYMFYGCQSLTEMPIIETETIYSAETAVFHQCTGLTTPSELHINTIIYKPGELPMHAWFDSCTSLTTTPKWTGTVTLYDESGNITRAENGLLNAMFQNSGITDASPIDIKIVTEDQSFDMLNNMFTGCQSLVTGPKIDLTSSTPIRYGEDIFSYCYSLESFTILVKANYLVGFNIPDGTSGTWYYYSEMDGYPQDNVPGTWTCEIYTPSEE